MPKTRISYALCAVSLVWLTATVSCSSLAAIAQAPLFVTNSADPNIMFTLDDSGSMQFETLPDEATYKVPGLWMIYMFPPQSGLYGGSDYLIYDFIDNVPTFDADNKYAAYYRSYNNNKAYYNPSITYKPWAKADNTSYPNAVITAAYHNPENTSKGTRNLTTDNTQNADWLKNDGSTTGITLKTFYPAAYFKYNGGDVLTASNYTRIEIKSSNAPFTGEGREKRTDCGNAAAASCSYEEEIQNFANWYTYYRSRILAARAGIGRAFAAQGQNMRVGFAAINKGLDTIDGATSLGAVVKGLRPFTGNDRTNFFNTLYTHPIPAAGTPLRRALDDVGKYFERTDNSGPWGAVPGTNDGTAHLQCRQSYNILMTDGYWNGAAAPTGAAQANVDGGNGPVITGPNNQSYQYTASNPYQDGWSNTLADVAMYYWYRDLRTDLDNRVPKSNTDPAFWQHLVNFTVGLGVYGTLNPAADLAGLKAGNIAWPQPVSDGGTVNVDDLWHAAVNSRGDFFSASDPETFAKALTDTLGAIAERSKSSAASIATNSSRLDTNTTLYQAAFDSNDWTGSLVAASVLGSNEDIDGNGALDPGEDVNGNGKLDLAGTVGATLWEAAAGIPSAAERKLFTYDPTGGSSRGRTFSWNNLNSYQQGALNTLNNTNDGQGQDRLNYLRGDASKEQRKPGGVFRNRVRKDAQGNIVSPDPWVLGDLVNSDPVFVGSENFGYQSLPTPEGGDCSLAGNTCYDNYRAGIAQRRRMIYVGANDGMLHAIAAGAFVSSPAPGHFDAGTGAEIFAYVPNAVFNNLSAFTSPSYTHKYYVDGPPRAGDVYFGNAWHTVLVGTTGAGGKGVFALDITDPDNFSDSKVLWDISVGGPCATAPCASSPTSTDSTTDTTSLRGFANNLGNTFSQASVVRMSNGKWAAVIGNGYDSSNKLAVLYIVDIETGNLIRAIDTKFGSSSLPNGLSTPITVDSNDDRIVDFIYAGDLQGNLWKFDVTDSNPSKWDVAYKSGQTPQPLFVACTTNTSSCADSNRQPITAKPQVGVGPSGAGLMIYFGTGKYFEVGDHSVSNQKTQSFYGIWDKNSGNANTDQVARTSLQVQTILSETTKGDFDLRVTTDTAVDYSSNNSKKGWYLDLLPPSSNTSIGERVVSFALLRGGRIIFTTLIPSANPCDFGGTGWLMELDALNGKRLPPDTPPWDIYGPNGKPDGKINAQDQVSYNSANVSPSGKKSKIGIIKTPGVVSSGSLEYKYTSGSTGSLEVTTESSGGLGGRQSWRQLR